MNNQNIFQKIVKRNLFPFLGTLFIFMAVPFTVWQLQYVTSFRALGSDFSLVPYPGLTWTEPKDYTISVLLSPQSPDEKLMKAKGMATTSITTEKISGPVFSFYDALLKAKGFTVIDVRGEPKKDSSWVASYILEGNYCEVQYYKTPYNESTNTVLLFFGSLTES